MIQAIINNPYRVLGLFVNSDKETISNRCKTLLANPGYHCETDFPIKNLPAPNRSKDSVTSAYITLTSTLGISTYAFYWFNKPKDENAIFCLNVGDLSKADDLFFGSLDEHNAMISCFLANDIYNAVIHFSKITEYSISEAEYGIPVASTDYIKIGFKNTLFAEVEYDVKTIITKKWSESFNLYALPRIMAMANKGEPNSYERAIHAVVHDCNIQELKEYGDYKGMDVRKTLDSLSLLAIDWIQQYLSNSNNLMKYSNACSQFKQFLSICPNELFQYYFAFAIEGCNQTSHFIIEPSLFDTSNNFVIELLHLYETGCLFPYQFVKELEDNSNMIAGIKSKHFGNGQFYSLFANMVSVLGLLGMDDLVKQYQKNSKTMTSAEVGYSFTSLMYISMLGLDRKVLPQQYSTLFDYIQKTIFGLTHTDPVTHLILLPDNTTIKTDVTLFLMENDVYEKYTNTVFGCQRYLKRFPAGPHAQEVRNKLHLLENNNTQKNDQKKNISISTIKEDKNKTVDSKAVKDSKLNTEWFTLKPVLRLLVFLLLFSILFGNFAMMCAGCIIGILYFIIAMRENFNDNPFYKVRLIMAAFVMVLSVVGLNYLS